MNVPAQIAVKLPEPDRLALTEIIAAIAAPHRSPVTLSEAVRAAIQALARSLPDKSGNRRTQ